MFFYPLISQTIIFSFPSLYPKYSDWTFLRRTKHFLQSWVPHLQTLLKQESYYNRTVIPLLHNCTSVVTGLILTRAAIGKILYEIHWSVKAKQNCKLVFAISRHSRGQGSYGMSCKRLRWARLSLNFISQFCTIQKVVGTDKRWSFWYKTNVAKHNGKS